ncbi:MAG: hypothetical protein KC621_04410 [Myxococcales bacterium]|nr:hypothetical protein [Myxococcales bacterium]
MTLDPVPKVFDPSSRWRAAEPGRFEEGHRIVDRVSLTYTRAELDGGTIGATAELFWLIDGAPYRVVGVAERYLAWRVHLRQMHGARA